MTIATSTYTSRNAAVWAILLTLGHTISGSIQAGIDAMGIDTEEHDDGTLTLTHRDLPGHRYLVDEYAAD